MDGDFLRVYLMVMEIVTAIFFGIWKESWSAFVFMLFLIVIIRTTLQVIGVFPVEP